MTDDNGLYEPDPPVADEDPDAFSGGYRIRSDQTWDLARAAYLQGETADSVCFRFDLSLGAFRERARKGGWRRCDQPDREPLPVSAEDDVDFDAGYAELAEHALRQLRRAVARGRASAAASWMRLHDRLSARVREIEAAETAARKTATAATTVARPLPVAMEQVKERLDARRREAEAYVARRDGASAVELAASVAARVGDLARRLAAADPRNGVARDALDQELDRLSAEIRAVRIPDDPDLPDVVCDPSASGPPFFDPP